MLLNTIESPAFVDGFGMVIVGLIFGLIIARLLLPSSFQRSFRNAVHHPREWLGF